MLEQTSGVSLPPHKQETDFVFVSMYVCNQFQTYSLPCSPIVIPLDVTCEDSEKPQSVYPQLTNKMKWCFTNAFFNACQTTRNHPGAFESAQLSAIRRVHVCIDWGVGRLEHLLWIV